jgi:hypothetical protein
MPHVAGVTCWRRSRLICEPEQRARHLHPRRQRRESGAARRRRHRTILPRSAFGISEPPDQSRRRSNGAAIHRVRSRRVPPIRLKKLTPDRLLRPTAGRGDHLRLRPREAAGAAGEARRRRRHHPRRRRHRNRSEGAQGPGRERHARDPRRGRGRRVPPDPVVIRRDDGKPPMVNGDLKERRRGWRVFAWRIGQLLEVRPRFVRSVEGSEVVGCADHISNCRPLLRVYSTLLYVPHFHAAQPSQ